MNIFVLDISTKTCAEFHCDKHVVKMMVEYAQIICTVQHLCKNEADSLRINYDKIYRPTHQNHPSVLWVMESAANYRWLVALFYYLHAEYQTRFGNKTHKSFNMVDSEITKGLPSGHGSIMESILPNTQRTPFRATVPQDIKTKFNVDFDENPLDYSDVMAVTERPSIDRRVVNAYREYYLSEKSKFAKWSVRRMPDWYDLGLQERALIAGIPPSVVPTSPELGTTVYRTWVVTHS